MGKFENGKMGKCENVKMGKFENEEQTINKEERAVRSGSCGR